MSSPTKTDDPSDFVKKIAEGTAKGAAEALLEYGEEKVKQLIKKIQNKELSIDDEETIEHVKKQEKTVSWKIYRDFINYPRLKAGVLRGLDKT